ncbi:MAG: amino acid permease, partial [bacterium]
IMGTPGALMMVAGAVLATVSSANASILSAARVNFAMGRDRILPEWLNEVHKDYRTPYRSILVTGLLILGLILIGTGIETLANVASFTYLVTYSLVHVAVIVMRRADPADYEPDFRLPPVLYPFVPLSGLILTVIILLQMDALVIGIGVGIMLLSVLWYLLYARTRSTDEHLVGEAILKPHERQQREQKSGYRIVVPIANPGTEQHLLRLAAASAQNYEDSELVVVNITEVPDQTALAQNVQFEEQRIQTQQSLLDTARDFAEEKDIGLRTRAIFGRDIGESILTVLDEEEADQILMGWKGDRSARDNILGSNIDQVVQGAPCEVTLVKSKKTNIRDMAAFLGSGGHATLAAKRAHEFVKGTPDGSLTFVHVNQPDTDTDPGIIETVTEELSIPTSDFDSRIIDSSDIEETLLKESHKYDTVCVGATETGPFQRVLFGSIPETLAVKTTATVAMVRKEPPTPRSISEAIKKRFSF